mgnify:FL=1
MITLQYKIEMDLCEDYCEMVHSWMKEHGVQSDKDGEDLWYDFFNLQKKSVSPQKRIVHYSKEFACPSEVELGLKLLVQKFENGDDVSLHLSKDATSPSEFDGLLYDWGIYHFHLGETIDHQTGRIERTGPVLFAKIDNENVYCINVYSHGKNVQQPWAKQDLLKIIHNNWPQTIAKWKLPDGIELCPESITLPSDSQYAFLRRSGISTAIFVDKGIAYISPGGGYMSTGHSQEIVLYCQRVHNTLKHCELHIGNSITSLVKQIEEITGKPVGRRLHFKLIEIDNVLYVEEKQSKITLFKVEC